MSKMGCGSMRRTAAFSAEPRSHLPFVPVPYPIRLEIRPSFVSRTQASSPFWLRNPRRARIYLPK